jgi:transposase InsO family protein
MSVSGSGRVGVPTKAYPIFSRIKGLKEVSNMLLGLRRFSKDEVAQERLRILQFYQRYGEKACLEAFGVDRKLVYIWRRRFNHSSGRLSSLVPDSTRPKRVRVSHIDLRVIKFISDLREKYPRLGKQKIKPLVDKYSLREGISCVSESTVGRVIKRHNLYFQKSGRIYHQPSQNRLRLKKTKRLRLRYSPKPGVLGNIQMDTLCQITDGVRIYLYSGIDIKGKFVLSLPYPALNSQNTLDFFKKLELIYPVKINSVQTDNGLEFQGVFEKYLKEEKIPHYFIYPRCPRINGVVERYQRTLEEEFLNDNLDLIYHPKQFSSKLAEYLVFYLTKRVHQSLGLKSPVDYLISQGLMSKMSWTSTAT